MKKLTFAASLLFALFVVSCASSSPDARIAARPQVFEALSTKHQGLVKQGELGKGMSKDAVSIAWGTPAQSLEGFRDGKTMERWDYQGRRPIFSNQFFGSYQSRIYGGNPYSGLVGGFGPQVVYVPYRKGTVWFLNGRVSEWESLR